MNDQKPDDGAESATPPAPAWARFFWPIILVAAALTLLLSVGVGRVIGAVLLSRSLAQTEVMPTAVPAGPNNSGAMQHAAALPGDGREIFPKGSPAPSASPATLSASAAPVTLYQNATSPAPARPQASAPPATPAVKVIVTHSTQTPAPPRATPHPTPAPTPKPTFAPIIQITPAPLMGGGG